MIRPSTRSSRRMSSLRERIRGRIAGFRKANAANVTITFALATVPMVGFVGAAVDYSHANQVKAAMQAAVDSTALMLSKNAAGLTSTQLTTKANEYFNALYTRTDSTTPIVAATYTSSGGSQVVINANTEVKASFMKLMGFATMKVAVDSQVKWGNSKLRVALALDTTGSMDEDGKMDALKIAAKSLLTTLKNAATTNGDVYVSIIPFSKGVNVGKTNVSQSWIKWSGQSDTWDENNGDCSSYSWSWAGEPQTKSSCLSRNGNWTVKGHGNWNGCIMDRDQDYDVSNAAPNTSIAATLFPAEQYDYCPAQMMGLSYDWTALNSKVDGLYPAGNTNQNIGLAWAFQSLTASPFTIPTKDSRYKYTDIIVLVTDGLNTQNRFSSSQSSIDARELKTCAAAKAAGIVIYTMQINTGGDPTQSVLQQCASTSDKFIEVKKSNQVLSAFNAIGTAISNVRIAQ